MTDPWEQVALWASDCEAATAFHYLRKSASKSERKRHIQICESLIDALANANERPITMNYRKPEVVIQRLRDAVADLKNAK
jgi:hypothetical protein